MLLCAITSRALLGESEAERRDRLAALARSWAANGVDFIQVRENDLAVADLTRLSAEVVHAVRQGRDATKVLLNIGAGVNGTDGVNLKAGIDIALESGSDGVHLKGGLSPDQLATAIRQVRNAWRDRRPLDPSPVISVSCHSVADVRAARAGGATLALFAPVFEKMLQNEESRAGSGLEALAEACRIGAEAGSEPRLPVLALGGVTLENAPQCVAAGAAGIAAIRLFLDKEFRFGSLR